MEVERLYQPKENRNAKRSAQASGLGWALLTGFILSDNILDISQNETNEGLMIVLVPLLAFISLCFILGLVFGAVAIQQLRQRSESGQERTIKSIVFAILGLGYFVLGPFLNQWIFSRLGLHLFTIQDFFSGL